MISARQWWIALASFLVISALAFYFILQMTGASGQATRGPSVYETAPSPYDQHLSQLDRQALDEAYKKYRISLFESWMRDPSGMPQRAIFGGEKARDVYINVMKAIEERPK